ncbi:MAG: phenylalanine--tRNA ligase subunit beta [Patescibacteria group bacterium]
MKVSLNWVKQFTEVQLTVEELVEKMGAQLGAVEEVIDIGKKYQGIVVAKVVSCRKHPNADKLKVCLIDDSKVTKDVKREKNNYVEVVCGAPNVAEGMLVAWLPPGVTVPSTHDKDPLILEAREIRGVVSNGMLASAHELAISDDHSGILELNPFDAKPGDDFAKTYKLDDYIIDIENKMFTHRPDLFGVLGVAREIAGITGQKFKSPDWCTREVKWHKPKTPLPLVVKNELPDLVPRFMAVAVRVKHNGSSPLWLQTYLARVGLRPINMLVDITNYLMMLTAQPLHAYDYDKVAKLSQGDTPTLVVRHPKLKESLVLLNGKTLQPNPKTIMIATDKVSIGIGGVMGGRETEVDENTTIAILECANFDMYTIRRTAMAHGLFTDAVTRFNKGQSPLQNDKVLGYALALLEQLEVGTWASEVIDDKGKIRHPVPVHVTAEFINSRLGLKLDIKEITTLLVNVEFGVAMNGPNLVVTPPFWRTDIEIQEDVVEEVGRLYGYDNVPLELPKRNLKPAARNPLLEIKSRIRENLAAAGANELLTYSFVHGNLLKKARQDSKDSYQISNALSPDLQYYRQTLTPSLLDKVHPNIKAGYDEFAIFEIGKTHNKIHGLDAEKVPGELEVVALIYAKNRGGSQAAYYTARKYLDYLAGRFGFMLSYEPIDKGPGFPVTQPFDPMRSATVSIKENGVQLGIVGEYHPDVSNSFKLPAFAAGFEISTGYLLDAVQSSRESPYVEISRFPKVTQDISLRVSVDTPYQQLYDAIEQQVERFKPKNTMTTLIPLDIYQRKTDKTHKQVTLRLSIASYNKTLTDQEVNKLLDEVAVQAKQYLKAERI